MKLIGSSSSPYVRKVRIVMAEKKLDYDFVTEDVWSADTTITQSNPLGKVPCLIMEAGEALFDSRVIVEYLDTLSPVGKLIPSTGRDRASENMGGFGRLSHGRSHPGTSGSRLGGPQRSAAQQRLDSPPDGQD